jgi:hypothetical protein
MKATMLYMVLFCIASAGFVAWRVHAVKTQDTSQFAIVFDPSISHPEKCESLLGLVDETLHADGISSTSTLTVLVIGDESTANEPWLLGRYSIARTRKVLEGRSANVRREQNMLRDISNKCGAVRRTSISPIFLGVRQGVAELRAQGCGHASQCRISVDSDLEENVEGSVKKSLNGSRAVKRGILPPIDNEGIEITFCGLAVTAGRIVDPLGRDIRKTPAHDAHREDLLKEVWSSLFAKPEQVTFEPYCPTASIREAREGAFGGSHP